ncbi:hypothetical protein RA267_28715, partial [Pseudomonas syringae pv. tagetis]|uniref:hypothetical protein n=1 Tax=Pseudomonas syringae group genomosp. 7 TaxID=251699 RepID=UPI00376F9CBF
MEQGFRDGYVDVASNVVVNLSEEELVAEQNVGIFVGGKLDLGDERLATTPRVILVYAWGLGVGWQQ